MQLTVNILWTLPCEVVSLDDEEEEEEGTTALDLDMAVVEERIGVALKELSGSSDVSIDDVSFAIRDKKLELLSNKPIFIIFTFFLGCIIVMLSLCCDGVVEVGTGSVVSCDGCEPTIMYFKWFNNRIC